MTIEANKTLASGFIARFNANDFEGVLGTLTDDATWWIAGKPGALPAAGTMTKDQLAGLFARMGGQLKDGLRMTVKAMTAERPGRGRGRVPRRAEERPRLRPGIPHALRDPRRQDQRRARVPRHAARLRRVVPTGGAPG